MPETALLTAEEFARLRGQGRWAELVRGVVVPVNPPGFEHGRIAGLIAARLIAFTEPRRLGAVLVESGFTLSRRPDSVRGPDVSFVRRERLAAAPTTGYFEGAPDLAVEVRSPGDALRDVIARAREFTAAGARLAWVIDPPARVAYVLTAGAQAGMPTGTVELDGGDVLPGFRLPLRELLPTADRG